MTTTTVPDAFTDLLDAQILSLATNGPDGRPQVTVVWFLADGQDVRISLNTDRAKVDNLRRDPAMTALILDPANPMRYLEIRGDAEIEPDPDYAFADQVGKKYGADLRAFDGENAERIKVTIRPTRVRPVDMSQS